jgi:hypothetical protein
MATHRKESSIVSNPPEEEFHPRTPLGRELWEIRQRVLDSGEPLLDWEELEQEIAERKGERTGSSR